MTYTIFSAVSESKSLSKCPMIENFCFTHLHRSKDLQSLISAKEIKFLFTSKDADKQW